MIRTFFRSITNYFLPSSIPVGTEEYREARILVNVLLVTGCSYILNSPTGSKLSASFVTYMTLGCAVLCFVVAFLFRAGLSKVFVAHLFMVINATAMFLDIWWLGGTNSPSAPALYLLPTVSMLLLGIRGSLIWLAIALGALSFFFWHEKTYGVLPIYYDLTQYNYYLMSSLYGTILCAYVIILVYEYEKKRALQGLVEKNDELIAAQNQLIQSEKLASLGELTAGIAHEIQNPLNFVNNFAELSVELVKELDEELEQPNLDKELIKELIADLVQNQEKINHHGKRASSIVKGMLEHSRTSSGERALTNINELADESLRLSYHSLRSKDKYFNAKFDIQLEENLPKINILPQDLSRVVINLCNNAFYAVNKRKQLIASSELEINYTPTVTVSTQNTISSSGVRSIVIRVSDNGTGMPESVKEKIFQPFFTTKPTGEGTGLGLSLSYDIITKGHGGTLEVNSKEGEGTEFKIILPIK